MEGLGDDVSPGREGEQQGQLLAPSSSIPAGERPRNSWCRAGGRPEGRRSNRRVTQDVSRDLHLSHEHPTCSTQKNRGKNCYTPLVWVSFVTSIKIFAPFPFLSLFFTVRNVQDPGLHQAELAPCLWHCWAEGELKT